MTVESPRQKEAPLKILDSLVLQLPRVLMDWIARKGYCRTPEEIIKDRRRATEDRYLAAKEALFNGDLKLTPQGSREIHDALKDYISVRVDYPLNS